MTGTTSSCNLWYEIFSGDSCSSVEKAFGITRAQFLAWNPAVSEDCAANFWVDESYCVGVSKGSAASTSKTTAQTSTSVPPVTSKPSIFSSVTGATTTSAASRTADSCPNRPTMTGVVKNCNLWYDIQSEDDCDSVPVAFNITRDEFMEWNPAVSSDCETNFWTNEAYCVGTGTTAVCTPTATPTPSLLGNSTTKARITTPPGTYSAISYSTPSYTSVSVDTAWPPQKTQQGQPSYCNKWYLVTRGDTCESIRARFATTMNMADFTYAWNPAVGTNSCDDLHVNWWVCVGVQPQTSAINTNTYTPTYSEWTETPFPTVEPTFIPSPTQSGIAEDCQAYYEATSNDTCATIASSLGYLSVDDLKQWNPALKSDCSGMVLGNYYCVASYSALPLPSTVRTAPSATQSGITPSCVAWYRTTNGDTCDLLPQMFGGTFTEDELLKWNPALKSDCSGLVIGNYYCVAVPDTATIQTSVTYTSTSTAAATATSSSGGPQPQQSGITADCSAYWLVGVKDNCTTIADVNNVDVWDFYAWNPAVGDDCSGLESDYYVCIGVPDNSTSSRPSSTSVVATATPATNGTAVVVSSSSGTGPVVLTTPGSVTGIQSTVTPV